jgi:predicted nucleotidyltransferase
MKEQVLEILEGIEVGHDVRVLYACESGSRAWGFPSADSDYDVRFIYLHKRDWYLSINLERKRDVIELATEGHLDLSGWDLRKALTLLRRSNPPLLEWLGSPIVYFEKYSVADRMRQLAPVCCSPVACMYHYFNMAKGNNRRYLQGDRVWRKKYFYTLRPILAVMWLERDMGVVPTEFQALVEAVVESDELRQEIAGLLAAKKEGEELDRGPRNPVISDFIDRQLARMEDEQFDKRVKKCPVDTLNEVFRNALREVWA